MHEWKPIETAPKNGTWVLLYEFSGSAKTEEYFPSFSVAKWYTWDSYGHDVTGWYVSDENCHEFTRTVDEPTHWMPLPPHAKARTEAAMGDDQITLTSRS